MAKTFKVFVGCPRWAVSHTLVITDLMLKHLPSKFQSDFLAESDAALSEADDLLMISIRSSE